MTGSLHCTHCGSTELELGFAHTVAQNSNGLSRWYSGPFEFGFLGIKRRNERRQGAIDTYRCTVCSHLEQFVDLRRQ